MMTRVYIALGVSFLALLLTLIGNGLLLKQVNDVKNERVARREAVNSAIRGVAQPVFTLLVASFDLDRQHLNRLNNKDEKDFFHLRQLVITGHSLTDAQVQRLHDIFLNAGYDQHILRALDTELKSIHELYVLSRAGIIPSN